MRRSITAVLYLVASGALWAQQYVISTYAGGVPLPTPSPGVGAAIGRAAGVATDAAGNIYFASSSLNSVFKLDRNGMMTRVAGNSRPGYSGDGGPATSARLSLYDFLTAGVAVDNAGNLFISDTRNHRVRRVSTNGIITTVAGDGVPGFSGDGGPAVGAHLNFPTGVATDSAGNLFIADLVNNRVRKVAPSGIITTAAGDGTKAYSGDGGSAASAGLNQPRGVAVDGVGNLFIADAYNFSIRKVALSGIITTVAGDGTRASSGDGVSASSARLDFATRVSVDTSGNLFIADGDRIRRVSPDGTIGTVAGLSTATSSDDGGPATSVKLFPIDLAVDGLGNVFIAGPGSIRRVSAKGIITTVVGSASLSLSAAGGFSGDGGPATSAELNNPASVAVDAPGSVFIADTGNFRVRKVSRSGTITTVAGIGCSGQSSCVPLGDGGPATGAALSPPVGVAVDGADNLFITDAANNRIRKISASGIITSVAGTGSYGFSGDGGQATNAKLGYPYGLAVNSTGDLLIADQLNNRIRKLSSKGIITTVAGDGSYGSSGDGGPATNAGLASPAGVAVDGAGNLFITGPGPGFGQDDDPQNDPNNRIRKVSPSGIITTVAGGGTAVSGDGGPATSVQLSGARAAGVDRAGNLYIADGSRVRKVSPSGIITTIAGNGDAGYSGDGGPAISATLNPSRLAVDGEGNVYVADSANNAVRVLRPADTSVLIGAIVDAASQRADSISPGKIVVIYGAGLGPPQLSQPSNGQPATSLGGTTVAFNGIAGTLLYTSATQVAAIVPYALIGTTAQVTVSYKGETSDAFTLSVAPSAPNIFTSNQTGGGQAAAINATDGSANSAINPVKIGGYISFYATGEGQTTGSADAPARPILPVRVTVDGIPAVVQYAGAVQGQPTGLMQVNVQIPSGVRPGGYVPIVLQVGAASTTPDAVWIAVSAN